MATRREFLKLTGAGAASLAFGEAGASRAFVPAQSALPRWRGFNLLDFFQALSNNEQSRGMVPEDDLKIIRDWGFDFVRLPMDYWLWIDADWRSTRKMAPDDVYKIHEATLEKIDRAVELCRRFGLHCCLNFHRAPGYCINERDSGREPFSLWRDPRAEEAFVFHWDLFARRYRDVPAADLSFNLVNEAPKPSEESMTEADYARAMTRATQAIRAVSPERIVIIDGMQAGKLVVESMAGAGVGQSVHAYWPGQISHYRASWVDSSSSFPEPAWPLLKPDGSVLADRAALEELYAPWAAAARRGVGVHCGEAGCYNKTPHGVFMAWFEDVMEILLGHGIGWALWNLRGPFGVLDSGRTDISYEDFRGHSLDRRLLDLLMAH
ncbi:MAG: Endoglucanase C307 precursor [candidate division BRC1 bacterium ADurb.BinA364]|nr:MAG: Endoglucanase C307 precursor [candidate division BRC1 bacterium ADurb.BinA364]